MYPLDIRLSKLTKTKRYSDFTTFFNYFNNTVNVSLNECEILIDCHERMLLSPRTVESAEQYSTYSQFVHKLKGRRGLSNSELALQLYSL